VINRPIMRWTLILLCLTLISWGLLQCVKKEEPVDMPLIALSSTSGNYDENLLTHRLIMLDAKYKLASQKEINTALSNSLFFLSEVKQYCKPNTDNLTFLQCANRILGNYFPYKETDLTSKGYSRAVSDCDLNVYLLLDAARLFNKQFRIIYSPGHAFIAYTDNQGVEQYWETIEPNNLGQSAELWTSGYAKTLHPFFYRPQSESMAENIYQLYLSVELPNDMKASLLSTLHDTLKDNPLYQSAYYDNKKDITQDDVNQLLYLLQRDTYSFNKKIIAARYFIKIGNDTKAKALLAEIPKSKCEQACLIEKEKTSWFYTPYVYFVKNKFARSEGQVNLFIITTLIVFSCIIITLGIFTLLNKSFFHIMHKTGTNKEEKKNKGHSEQ